MTFIRGNIPLDPPARKTRRDAGTGRWSSGYCPEYTRQWREKHREHLRKYHREYMRRRRRKQAE